MKPAIRAIALVALRRGGEVLLMSGFDRVKQRTFYRAPGGGIEFGETAEAAARREILEELEVEIGELHQLGILENLFTLEGVPGHEVVFIFEADWPEGMPTPSTFEAREDDGTPFTCHWLPIDDLHDRPGVEGEVVPPGFLSLLGQHASAARSTGTICTSA